MLEPILHHLLAEETINQRLPKMFVVTVGTDDGEEYTLERQFDNRDDAEAELYDILSGEPSYIDGARIDSGSVDKI